ncbi:16S rRNA (cytosine(1402)-N(4))-methyltransferase RsmH [Candidatus Cloacimonadota bacterium]
MENYHDPVMLKESIEALNIREGLVYVDATLGGGGHSEAILNSGKDIRLISFDQDQDAIDHCLEKFGNKYSNATLIHDNFSNFWTGVALQKVKKIDGILFDLGVSSYQINVPEKGFSFSLEGRLDMRMDNTSDLTAYDVVNKFTRDELRKIFLEYGEEREAGRIASEIIRERENKEIISTLQLADIIDRATRSHQKMKAKARIFQAIRIYLNDEINVLTTALQDAVRVLNTGGRLAVISYHSLEDRVVKNLLRYHEKICICPPSFPQCNCNKVSTLKILTRKPIVPSEEEIARNPRARSAKLRVAEKKEVQ